MDFQRFSQLLDSHHTFPCDYVYKFIVPALAYEQVEEILQSFGCSSNARSSQNGRFISITAKKHLKSVEEIIEVYRKMQAVEGIICL